MTEEKTFDNSFKNKQTTAIVHGILVCLLLTLMVYAIVQIGEYIIPDWNGDYLIWVGLLIAIEAQYSHRRLQSGTEMREGILYRVTELVFLIISTKILLYVLNGFDSFWTDLQLWSDDFLFNFFTGEFLFAIFILLCVWSLATFMSSKLYYLEGDQELLNIERESRMTIFRKEVRDSLSITILVIGILMTSASTFILLLDRTKGVETTGFPFKMLHVVVFFVLGLVLLSLTQFSVLRVHWFLDRVPIQNNLILRWVFFSFILLLVVATVSFMLPTRYAGNFLDFLNILLSIILWILWGIAFLVTFPLAYIISLIFRLFGKSSEQIAAVDNIIPKMPEQAGPSGGLSEWIKSILFWSIFLLVILFSVVYFLRQNKNFMQRLNGLKVFNLLKRLFQGIRQYFHGATSKIITIVDEKRRQLLNRLKGKSFQRFNFINPHKLTPREQVIFYYFALIRRGQEIGIPRQPSQTPSEYQQELNQGIPEAEIEFESMTQAFLDARYSQKPIEKEKSSAIEKAWSRTRRFFRDISRKKSQHE